MMGEREQFGSEIGDEHFSRKKSRREGDGSLSGSEREERVDTGVRLLERQERGWCIEGT